MAYRQRNHGPFEFHTQHDLPVRFRLSNNAWLMFVRCGNESARTRADGHIDADVPHRIDYTPRQSPIDARAGIAELVAAGLWTPTERGWAMEYGPSESWDAPLPEWRYSAPDDSGIDIGDGSMIYPEPS